MWVHVVVAALVMLATLPGRTQGLGLFTEPILKTTAIDRTDYGAINLAATFLGALFCVPVGWMLDHYGPRFVLVALSTLLSASVVVMGTLESLPLPILAVLLLFTRGFGQSALSVVSLLIVSRSAQTRSGLVMGVYSCLISVFFIAAFGTLSEIIKKNPDDWQSPWVGIGIGVLICGILGGLLTRNDHLGLKVEVAGEEESKTFAEAIASGTFWAFALGTSFYGMVASGTSLFNESILAERGFNKELFLNATIVGIPVGLVSNLVSGYLATIFKLNRLLAVGLGVFAVALSLFPFIQLKWQLYLYAMTIAAAGGTITVCFFSVWRKAYGPGHLGRIQGAAQFLTVIGSGLGQWLFPYIKENRAQYTPLFPALAAVALALALFSAWVRIPVLQTTPGNSDSENDT